MKKKTSKKNAAPELDIQSLSKDMVFLVIDDDASVRKTVIEYLISFGYTNMHEASDGLEALNVLGAKKIDFIISDWEMPGMNGLDLLTTLRTNEKFKDIPFIMITSPQSQETQKVQKAATARVNAYIIKPFRSKVLRDKIEALLVPHLGDLAYQQKDGVLLVDDDKSVRETVGEYLREIGYSMVFEAGDGEEAFSILKTHHEKIAFVVSDWEMPKLAGIDLLRRIRSDSDLTDMPFIMITSQTSIEHMKLQSAVSAHVDHYLLKPFKVSELRDKVDQSIARTKLLADVKSKVEIANGYLNAGKIIDAEKVFEQVLQMDRNNIDAHLGMAELQIAKAPQKGVDKAIQYIRAAIRINPANEKSYIDLALIFERALSLEKAIAILNEGLHECSFSEKLHFHLGRLYFRRGLVERGVEELKKSLELKPDYKEAMELLSRALTATERNLKNDN